VTDDERIEKAKRQQDYDADTPRCFTCLYFKRERRFDQRLVKKRSGGMKVVTFPVKKRIGTSHLVDRCAFGNFEVKAGGACKEWRGRQGEVLAEEPSLIPLRLVR
jgi:hypothetical protein